jgi:hypothetical protein
MNVALLDGPGDAARQSVKISATMGFLSACCQSMQGDDHCLFCLSDGKPPGGPQVQAYVGMGTFKRGVKGVLDAVTSYMYLHHRYQRLYYARRFVDSHVRCASVYKDIKMRPMTGYF